jgi:hypothetical protein
MLQLIADVLDIAHSVGQSSILGGLLVKPRKDECYLLIPDQMVD